MLTNSPQISVLFRMATESQIGHDSFLRFMNSSCAMLASFDKYFLRGTYEYVKGLVIRKRCMHCTALSLLDSSDGKVTGDELDDRRSIPSRGRDPFILHRIHTGYTVGTRSFFPGVNAVGAQS